MEKAEEVKHWLSVIYKRMQEPNASSDSMLSLFTQLLGTSPGQGTEGPNRMHAPGTWVQTPAPGFVGAQLCSMSLRLNLPTSPCHSPWPFCISRHISGLRHLRREGVKSSDGQNQLLNHSSNTFQSQEAPEDAVPPPHLPRAPRHGLVSTQDRRANNVGLEKMP